MDNAHCFVMLDIEAVWATERERERGEGKWNKRRYTDREKCMQISSTRDILSAKNLWHSSLNQLRSVELVYSMLIVFDGGTGNGEGWHSIGVMRQIQWRPPYVDYACLCVCVCVWVYVWDENYKWPDCQRLQSLQHWQTNSGKWNFNGCTQ